MKNPFDTLKEEYAKLRQTLAQRIVNINSDLDSGLKSWFKKLRNGILKEKTAVKLVEFKKLKTTKPKSIDASKISSAGIDMIKEHEKLRLNAYMPTKNDVPTIGYGHTKGVKMGDRINKSKAIEFLKGDIAWVQRAIARYIKVPLNQNQYDALASWVYNLGARNLLNSTLLRVLNEGKHNEVPTQMKRWDKQKGKTLRGLTKRRKQEAELWAS